MQAKLSGKKGPILRKIQDGEEKKRREEIPDLSLLVRGRQVM
jgi:hypothetical protein